MDILTASAQFSLLEVVDTGRRRRWTVAGKVRIIEESLSGSRLASLTVRRYGLSRGLLFACREGRPGGIRLAGLIPAVAAPDAGAAGEPATGGRVEVANPEWPADRGGSGFRCGRPGPSAGRGGATAMIPAPSGVRVWLATGHTDMTKGFPSLSPQVQEMPRRDPLSGHLFVFRGRRGDLLKVIRHDGQGAWDDSPLHEFRIQGIGFGVPDPAIGALARIRAISARRP